MRRILYFLVSLIVVSNLNIFISGCGTIGAPTGGKRDSIPPKLINAIPLNGTRNFTGKKITLYFDEYVQLVEKEQNILVSPTPKTPANIDYKLRTVTIKLRDSLEPNTTYLINMGNSIRDLNEGNILRNFSYVFSTGAYIDSLEYSGQVKLAETGKLDTSLIVMLYKNLADSAVQKQKPNYIARLDGGGNFTFHNLAAGTYKVYALQDLSNSRVYNDKKELFAFLSSPVLVKNKTKSDTLLAYVELKPQEKATAAEKKLKFTTRITTESQDLLSSLEIIFNKPLKNFDIGKVILADTLNHTDVAAVITIDSTRKRITVSKSWKENESYKLILSKAITDTAGNTLVKSDTLRFKTKKEEDYGSLTINFTNIASVVNPVLVIVGGTGISYFPITSTKWSRKLFIPGEYEIRILSDLNKNNTWDPGNFALKRQPEKVFSVPKKISVRGGGWENEFDVSL